MKANGTVVDYISLDLGPIRPETVQVNIKPPERSKSFLYTIHKFFQKKRYFVEEFLQLFIKERHSLNTGSLQVVGV